jgi:hypothetical protein
MGVNVVVPVVLLHVFGIAFLNFRLLPPQKHQKVVKSDPKITITLVLL